MAASYPGQPRGVKPQTDNLGPTGGGVMPIRDIGDQEGQTQCSKSHVKT